MFFFHNRLYNCFVPDVNGETDLVVFLIAIRKSQLQTMLRDGFAITLENVVFSTKLDLQPVFLHVSH